MDMFAPLIFCVFVLKYNDDNDAGFRGKIRCDNKN